MSIRNPFRGANAYGTGEALALHGRDYDLRRLQSRLLSDKVVLVHAETGAGKSSLVNAGLSQSMRSLGFHIYEPIRPSELFMSVIEAADKPSVLAAIRSRPPLKCGETEADIDEGKRPRFIVFDQCEEVFTLSRKPSQSASALFQAIGELLTEPDVWSVLIVRDDYVARVLSYSHYFQSRLESRYDVPLLSRSVAKEIIAKTLCCQVSDLPAGVGPLLDSATDASLNESPKSSERRNQNDAIILPLFLQVMCTHWFQKATDCLPKSADSSAISAALAAGSWTDARHALVAFIDAAFNHAVASIRPPPRYADQCVNELRQWCEVHLVDGRTRKQVSFPVDHPEGLTQLCAGYLISGDGNAGRRIELSHDTFATALTDSNRIHEQSRSTSLLSQRYREWIGSKQSPKALLGPVGVIACTFEVLKATHAERRYLAASATFSTTIMLSIALSVGVTAYMVHVSGKEGARAAEERLKGLQDKLTIVDGNLKSKTREAERWSIQSAKSREQIDEQMKAMSSTLKAAYAARSLRDDEVALSSAIQGYVLSQRLLYAQPLLGQQVAAISESVLYARLSGSNFVRRRTLVQRIDRARFGTDGALVDCAGESKGAGPCTRASLDTPLKAQGYTLTPRTNHAPDKRAYALADLREANEDPEPALSLRLTVEDSGMLQALAGNGAIPSESSSDRILATRLRRLPSGAIGASLLKSGVAIVWELADDTANRALAGRTLDRSPAVLKMRAVDRLVSGDIVDAWLGMAGGFMRLRVLSAHGEWAELTLRGSALEYSPGNLKAEAAQIVSIGGSVVFATNYAWCHEKRCSKPSGFVSFTEGEAFYPMIALAAPDNRPAVIGRNGKIVYLDLESNRSKVGGVIRKFPRSAGRIVDSLLTDGLIVLPASRSGNARTLGRIVGFGTETASLIAPLPGADSLEQVIGAAPILDIATSGAYMAVVTAPIPTQDSLLATCRMEVNKTLALSSCERVDSLTSLSGDAISSMAMATAGNRVVIALGSRSGTITTLEGDLSKGSSARKLFKAHSTAVHVGSIADVVVTLNQSKGAIRLLSAGGDGQLIKQELPLDESSNSSLVAMTPPVVLFRSKRPLVLVRAFSEHVVAGTDDGRILRIELNADALIRQACAILSGEEAVRFAGAELLPGPGGLVAVEATCAQAVTSRSIQLTPT